MAELERGRGAYGALTVPFLAEPDAVGALRRQVRSHLVFWGLEQAADEVQLCVSELVTNVIVHVGVGTPVTLRLSLLEEGVRVEVSDPVCKALPVLLSATDTVESGRGLALLDAVASHWGVALNGETKTVWCEVAHPAVCRHGGARRLGRAEAALQLYRGGPRRVPRLATVTADDGAIGLISDVLHWLAAHGRSPEDVLDQAQMHFEAEAS